MAYLVFVPCVLLAYSIAGYGLYSHLLQTWDMDDPLMLLPASGILVLPVGILLAIFLLMFRRQATRWDYGLLGTSAALGLGLLPGVFIAGKLFHW
jgi:hypothetical protein